MEHRSTNNHRYKIEPGIVINDPPIITDRLYFVPDTHVDSTSSVDSTPNTSNILSRLPATQHLPINDVIAPKNKGLVTLIELAQSITPPTGRDNTYYYNVAQDSLNQVLTSNTLSPEYCHQELSHILKTCNYEMMQDFLNTLDVDNRTEMINTIATKIKENLTSINAVFHNLKLLQFIQFIPLNDQVKFFNMYYSNLEQRLLNSQNTVEVFRLVNRIVPYLPDDLKINLQKLIDSLVERTISDCSSAAPALVLAIQSIEYCADTQQPTLYNLAVSYIKSFYDNEHKDSANKLHLSESFKYIKHLNLSELRVMHTNILKRVLIDADSFSDINPCEASAYIAEANPDERLGLLINKIANPWINEYCSSSEIAAGLSCIPIHDAAEAIEYFYNYSHEYIPFIIKYINSIKDKLPARDYIRVLALIINDKNTMDYTKFDLARNPPSKMPPENYKIYTDFMYSWFCSLIPSENIFPTTIDMIKGASILPNELQEKLYQKLNNATQILISNVDLNNIDTKYILRICECLETLEFVGKIDKPIQDSINSLVRTIIDTCAYGDTYTRILFTAFIPFVNVSVQNSLISIITSATGISPISSPLHHKSNPITIERFTKSGTETYILPSHTEASVRIIPKESYITWLRAFVDWESWYKLGFDYVPVEPIVGVNDTDSDNMVAITTTNLSGPSLSCSTRFFSRYINELSQRATIIRNQLVRFGIIHGHPHEGNFVVVPYRLADGRIDFNRCPRIYIIDFDQAYVRSKK